MRAVHSVGAAVFLSSTILGSSGMAAENRTPTDIVTDGSPTGHTARRAITAALALLPRVPTRIAVMDISGAKADVRERLRRLDAFTVAGNSVIYLVDGTELLRGVQAGSAFHHAVLAAVIWHEMAHVEGADEREARAAESKLWTSFVRDGLTDPVTALRYLDALERRPDHTLRAAR